MGNEVKIKGQDVFLDGEKVGYMFFHRGYHRQGIDIDGGFIFIVNGSRYRFDTSCFGYSNDARQYVRGVLGSGGAEALRQLTESSTLLT